ncbi:MAG: ribosome-recycling factor [Candidatus Colwellbacteria bacterium]|jgi:ribosome recycling factor|nr:ribosome-recycling factor [Candidatus Colwellbacteria bacterium]MCK9497464.1 ribosome-recycling factor [Candidatus Colwellbacteria bacterium]MDD3752542.1 ribosome-recycling factor [Candidatus Colwellbacteria bacterium]MDD4818794.1 ribosome-recycling factor [Candidatus Colwellbacteria bacterium]
MDPLKEISAKMDEIVSFVKNEFSGIRSNRPTTKLIENIKVNYMGADAPLNHIATLGINPPRDIVISPWDKGIIPAITKAIEEAGLGLGITADSSGVRLTMPELSKERKEELVKLIRSIAEENRIKMRSVRDKTVKEINAYPEDQKFKAKNDLQKLVDAFNDRIDNLVEEKTSELKA